MDGINAGRKTTPSRGSTGSVRRKASNALRSYRTEWDEKARACRAGEVLFPRGGAVGAALRYARGRGGIAAAAGVIVGVISPFVTRIKFQFAAGNHKGAARRG